MGSSPGWLFFSLRRWTKEKRNPWSSCFFCSDFPLCTPQANEKQHAESSTSIMWRVIIKASFNDFVCQCKGRATSYKHNTTHGFALCFFLCFCCFMTGRTMTDDNSHYLFVWFHLATWVGGSHVCRIVTPNDKFVVEWSFGISKRVWSKDCLV